MKKNKKCQEVKRIITHSHPKLTPEEYKKRKQEIAQKLYNLYVSTRGGYIRF